MTTSKISGGLVAAALGLLVWTAAAQDKEQVVKERQETMDHMSKLLATARAFGQGRAEQPAALQSVAELRQVMNGAGRLFPPGTSMADMPGKSAARAELWQQPEKASAATRNTMAEIDKLEATVKAGDREAIVAQANATWNQGCQSCHRDFRVER